MDCPNCHKDIPDDSDFCMYCGAAVTPNGYRIRRKEKEENALQPNPVKNELGKFAIILVILTLFIFDFLLATIVANITGTKARWVFVISTILYICAIVLGIMSLIKDSNDKKKGYEATGNGSYAVAAIVFGIFIILLNMVNVLLK